MTNCNPIANNTDTFKKLEENSKQQSELLKVIIDKIDKLDEKNEQLAKENAQLKELLNQQLEYLNYIAKLSSATYKSTDELISVVNENNKNVTQSIQGLQQQVISLKDLTVQLINKKFNEVISHYVSKKIQKNSDISDEDVKRIRDFSKNVNIIKDAVLKISDNTNSLKHIDKLNIILDALFGNFKKYIFESKDYQEEIEKEYDRVARELGAIYFKNFLKGDQRIARRVYKKIEEKVAEIPDPYIGGNLNLYKNYIVNKKQHLNLYNLSQLASSRTSYEYEYEHRNGEKLNKNLTDIINNDYQDGIEDNFLFNFDVFGVHISFTTMMEKYYNDFRKIAMLNLGTIKDEKEQERIENEVIAFKDKFINEMTQKVFERYKKVLQKIYIDTDKPLLYEANDDNDEIAKT